MSDNSKIVELDLNDILPNRFQPRIKFNEESIIELSESIKEHGVLQPIIVRPIGDKYEIVTGERRYKASMLAGLKTIPTRILDVNDKDSAEIALIENVQRKDLTPIEEAISYKKILDMGYLTQEQLATKLGRSQSTIANKIRLLNLCDEVQEALMEDKISERHARSLLRLEKASTQREMLKRIISERLTVRKVDDEIKKVLEKEKIEQDSDKEQSEKLGLLESGDISKSNKDNDVVDITDLFVKLEDDKNEGIEGSDSDDEVINNEVLIEETKKQEENGENDNMMNNMQDMNSSSTKFFNVSQSDGSDVSNNGSNFVFTNGNSDQNMMANKMSDLLAPQSSFKSSSMPNNFNQGNNFSVPTDSSVDFTSNSALDNPQPTNSSMFSSLINSNQSDDFIDDKTFKDFLNPAYVDGTKQEGEPANKSVIDSSVFAKFLDPEYTSTPTDTGVINDNKPLNADDNPINQFNGSMPNLSKASIDEPMVQPVQTDNSLMGAQIGGFNSMDHLENIPNQYQAFNGMLASEKKPDLLAPMGSSSHDDNSNQQDSNIFVQGVPSTPTTNPFASQFFAPTSEQPLTPDSTINNLNLVSEPEIPKSIDVPPASDDQPIFITASNQPSESVMPNSPIIDNPNMSKLLEVDNPNSQSNGDEVLSSSDRLIKEETIPTTIAETANINVGRQVVGSVENQPIIITDYNKQYDPVLPTDMVAKTPQIDFRQIINMIRDLNDKIESYGYEIDTEEYDLADLYQVIIKITKK